MAAVLVIGPKLIGAFETGGESLCFVLFFFLLEAAAFFVVAADERAFFVEVDFFVVDLAFVV